MFKKFFSRQARKPSGIVGRLFMSRLFEKGNAPLNRKMLELVAAGGQDRILEIGFGNGSTIMAMADALDGGIVEGIDFSDAMLSAAVKRNRKHIDAGTVKLRHGNFDTSLYPVESFDTVCSANTIYFWQDRSHTITRIREILRPGGKLVLAYVDKSKMRNMPLDMEVFSPISHEEVRELLETAGFSKVRFFPEPEGGNAMYCVEAVN